MKRFLQVCLGTAVVSLSVSAWAAPESGAMGGSSEHPCKAIAEACKSAGFTKGGAAGKELMHDCIKPVMSGQTVGNISVPEAEIAACKAKMAARGGMMHGGQGGQGGGAPAGGGQQ